MQAAVPARDTRRGGPQRPTFARAPVFSAMLALAVVLAVASPFYGYQRDELYFRILEPAWGYLDQPPLTPLLTRAAVILFGDTVVSLRIVSLVVAVGSVAIVALITREVGGGRWAQGLAAWGAAGASVTLMFGHVLLTATLDLVVWPAALLFVIRALLREDGRWWLAAGAVIGLSTYNKLLGGVLLLALAIGLALVGPWRWFRSGWLWAGVGVAVLLAVPNVLYQVLNGMPQLGVGQAMGAVASSYVRVAMWPYLVMLVGPVLTVFWAVALVQLVRQPELRPIRLIVVAFVVVLAFVFVAGTQLYYSAGMLMVLVAIGAVRVAGWARTRARRGVLIALVAINGLGCALASIPVLPASMFEASPLDAVNRISADQIGWEEYVAQIGDVARQADADVIVASNYGEAGALDRFGLDLPPVVSGHNALWAVASPPEDARTVVITSQQGWSVQQYFASCDAAGTLDNGVRVANEEQGLDILVCREPVLPWSELWPRFAHVG